MIQAAIAFGIVINLFCSAVVGFSAAGLVVPGYLALHLGSPARVAATLVIALAAWAITRYGLARVMILYGRRQLGVVVLVGFVLQAGLDSLLPGVAVGDVDLRVIGYIVPGLIANEALGEGLVPAVAMTLIVASLTRIALLVSFGWAG